MALPAVPRNEQAGRVIALLLALQFVLPDSSALYAVADSARVPHEVIAAVAWMETRDGQHVRRGPGREQCDSTGCHRVCREIGRMQINPCIRWKFVGCDSLAVPRQNVRCGAEILRERYERFGSWPAAIRAYNGAGPMADAYLLQALAYIGRRRLTLL